MGAGDGSDSLALPPLGWLGRTGAVGWASSCEVDTVATLSPPPGVEAGSGKREDES